MVSGLSSYPLIGAHNARDLLNIDVSSKARDQPLRRESWRSCGGAILSVGFLR